jgi:hypothetical protein
MALLKALARTWTSHGARGRCAAGLVMWALLFCAGPEASAQTPVSREYQIKAVFLFNFAQFVDWPSDSFTSPQAPLVIGVLGDDPFDGYLDETVRDEKVNNHPLVIRRYRWVDDIGTCHILFISRSASGQLGEILARLKDRHILTVGDVEDFARLGGMIRFVTENNKIRLRINVDAAKAAELTISSKLLRPAKIVTTGEN